MVLLLQSKVMEVTQIQVEMTTEMEEGVDNSLFY